MENTNRLSIDIHYNESAPKFNGNTGGDCRQENLEIPCSKTAVVISDMWDKHWCKGATKRVNELAPKINEAITQLRNSGVTIVHCPSDTSSFYANNPALDKTKNIQGTYWSQDPHWLYKYENKLIPEITNIADPNMVQCDCGPNKCDSENGVVWKRQNEAIKIDEDKDYICMDNKKIYDLLKSKEIEYVLMMGVHTNMCILNRHFGIKKLLLNKIQPILIRDMTDGMLPRECKPFKDHFSALDDVFTHIETYYCPTTTTASICIKQSKGTPIKLRSERFRFSEDKRVCKNQYSWGHRTPCRLDFDKQDIYQHKKYGLPSCIKFKIDNETLISDLEICYGNDEERIDSFSREDALGNWYIIQIPFGEYITKIEGISAIRSIEGHTERVIIKLIMTTNKDTKRYITTKKAQATEPEMFSIQAPTNHALVALFGSFWEPDASTPKYALDAIGFYTQEVYPLQITIEGKIEYDLVIKIKDLTNKDYKVMFFEQKYYWQLKQGVNIVYYNRIDCQDKDGKYMYVRFYEKGFAFYDVDDNKVSAETQSTLNCKNWDNKVQHIERCFNY